MEWFEAGFLGSIIAYVMRFQSHFTSLYSESMQLLSMRISTNLARSFVATKR